MLNFQGENHEFGVTVITPTKRVPRKYHMVQRREAETRLGRKKRMFNVQYSMFNAQFSGGKPMLFKEFWQYRVTVITPTKRVPRNHHVVQPRKAETRWGREKRMFNTLHLSQASLRFTLLHDRNLARDSPQQFGVTAIGEN